MDKVELLIQGQSSRFIPAVKDGVAWETQRKNNPGKLTFTVYRDDLLKVEEGNSVKLMVDGQDVFSGYVFTITRTNDPMLNITAYDQIRYLKNKDTYIFKKVKASEIISMVASDYGLRLGSIADTSFVIISRVEENTTLLDMIQNALDITTSNTKKLFVLYDDNGKLTLRNTASMQIGLVVDADTSESFSYDTSIDTNVYNRVKLSYEDEKSGKRKIFTAQDGGNMAKWGTLQYYESISDTQNAQNKANTLLALYNRKLKHLRINGVFGDLRVRAGCYVIVQLDLGDTVVHNLMIVERCVHRFNNREHRMDLELSGGGFSA